MGSFVSRYSTRWLKERYKEIYIRRDVLEKLQSIKSDKSYSDILDEMINIYISYKNNKMNEVKQDEFHVDVKKMIDEVMSENSEYIEENFKSDSEGKLIRYPGGDYFIFDDLNKYFMMSNAETFVEVFGGSCHSSMNVSREKFRVIICNDIDSLLINIFNMVKNSPELFLKRLSVFPVSRELNMIAEAVIDDPNIDVVTKSVMLFYLFRTSMSGIPRSGFSVNKKINIAKKYVITLASIKEYSKKIKDIIFESKDYKDIIKLYDSEKTLFYLDPPYVSLSDRQSREKLYRFSFTVSDLKTLAAVLRNIKGDFVLKISEDNYKLIEKDLPEHEHVTMKKIRQIDNTAQKEEGKRETWNVTIAYRIKNIKKEKNVSLLSKYINNTSYRNMT